MNTADWIAVVIIAIASLSGLQRGLLTGVGSLLGLIGGAIAGAKLAPGVVGDGSGYVPVVALAGAGLGGVLGQTLGLLAGRTARRAVSVVPPLRWLDSLGGIALGAATGLALVWAAGAVALYAPGQSELRRLVQESRVVSALTERLPPERVMDAVGPIDRFSSIFGPRPDVAAPEPLVGRDPDIRRASSSVVRIRGVACGLGVEGTGWVARPELVVTNAHVVAGIDEPRVDRREGEVRRARIVSFDARNDIAVLRVPGLPGRPLPLGEPTRGLAAALLGYPLDGPYRVTPVRVGGAVRVGARDAYGRLQVNRPVVLLRGDVQSGNSGGPIVDRQGRVVATVFARRRASQDGYAVPNAEVRRALANVGAPLDTSCVGR